jgi:hypothetical protein
MRRAMYEEPAYVVPPLGARRPEPAAQVHSGRGSSRIALPHPPVAHVLLIVGIAAMFYAIGQPWGVGASGIQVFVKDFGSARLSNLTGVDTSALATQTATYIAGAAAVLSAAMILFNLVVTVLNRILRVVGLSGCASLLFFPALWGAAALLFIVLLAAAGFAGLGALGQMPVVRDHGFAVMDVQQHSSGFYLWCGGIGAVFLGMLGQLALRRR